MKFSNDFLTKKLEKSKIESKEKDIFDDENFQKTITCKEIMKPSADLNIPNLKIEILEFFFIIEN